jgi:hypothetical protein
MSRSQIPEALSSFWNSIRKPLNDCLRLNWKELTDRWRLNWKALGKFRCLIIAWVIASVLVLALSRFCGLTMIGWGILLVLVIWENLQHKSFKELKRDPITENDQEKETHRYGYEDVSPHVHVPLARKDLYEATVQLITATANETSFRFYNFAMTNSILILAWATLFKSNSPLGKAKCDLILLSLVGCFTSIAWAAYMGRSRSYISHYHEMARALEGAAEKPHDDARKDPLFGPLTMDKYTRFSTLESIFRGRRFLYTFAFSFAAVFWLLFVTTLCTN